MTARRRLVRHTAVARRWNGRCYGRSDVGLSRDGIRHARDLAPELAARRPDIIVHSGLRRTRFLAEAVADSCACPIAAEPRWQERDFGTWEGRTWNAIWRETGDLMDRMMTDPHGFRPGGGETTAEMAARAVAAWRSLPMDKSVLVIAHGGPIAAVLADVDATPIAQMTRHIPATGEGIDISSW